MTIPDMLGAAEKDVAENGRHGEAIDPGRAGRLPIYRYGATGPHDGARGRSRQIRPRTTGVKGGSS